jgi:ribosome-binding protein aMBF1 (putative translation factor)
MKITTVGDDDRPEPDTCSRLAERLVRRSKEGRGLSASDLAAHLTGEDAAAIDAVGGQ